MAIPVASLRAVIGVDGDEVAAARLAGFGTKVEETSTKSTTALTRIGVAARVTDEQLAHFGVPFSSTAGRVITGFEGIERRGTSLGSTLSNLGRGEATAAAVGLAAVATEGVHLADAFELSHARLETAAKDSGLEFDALSGAVKTTDKTMEHLGFTNADTESSLARLLTRTHSMTQAQRDEQIAADLSAGTHKDLSTATQILVQVEAGRYTQLSRLGIATKQQIADFHSSADAVDFLAKTYKGQAAAAADTFAGKMKVLSAEGTDLGTTIGVAVVPKLELAAQGALGGVHAFQDLNSETHGLAGTTLGLAAAFPVVVFAGSKLISVGKAIAGTYQDTASWLKNFGTTSTASAASAEASATAVSTARQIEAAAATQAGAAEKAFATALAASAAAEDGDLESAVALTSATDRLAAAKARLAVASESTAEAESVAAAGSAALDGGISAAGLAMGGAGIAAVGLMGIIYALGASDRATKQDTDALTSAVQRQGVTLGQASGQQIVDYISKNKDVQSVLKATGISAVDFTNAVQHGGPALDSVRQKLKAYTDAAQAHNDWPIINAAESVTGKVNEMRTAYQNATNEVHVHNTATNQLRGSQLDTTKSTGELTDASDGASTAVAQGAAVATQGGAAYAYLASGAKTAAAALSTIEGKTFGSVTAKIAVDTSDTSFQKDLDALNSNGTTASGGGGSGETATAAAINHKEKELALRDALRQVGTTATAVTEAEHQLTSAREQQATANQALIVAETNYKNVLDGVAASSKTARDAQTALAQAQRDAQSSALDVQDAERNVALARSDSRLNGFGVTDAETTLSASRGAAATANQTTADAESQLAAMRASGTATADDLSTAEAAVTSARAAAAPLNEQAQKDEVALDDARINAQAGDEAITRAELELKNQRAQAKQKTDDLTSAERTLKFTLDGYPKSSAEAKAATQQLKDAQDQQRSATDGVTSAVQGLVSAQDQIPSSALAVERAQADLDGKLTAASGGFSKAGGAADSYRTKLNALASDAIAGTDNVIAYQRSIGSSVGHSILAGIQALENYVNLEPALQSFFGGKLSELYSKYADFLIHQAQAAPSLPFGTAATHGNGAGNVKRHASGGMIGAGEFGVVGDIAGQGGELVRGLPGGGAEVFSHRESLQLLGGGDGALLAEIRGLRADLRNQRPGVHVDTIIARDAEDTMRKIDQQQKRQYLLANI